MTFADVIGQEHVVRTLKNAIVSNHVANAYLFIGPRGIGKTPLSRIFATALNCIHEDGSQDVEPCAHCRNCEDIAAGRSLDVIELDAASHNKVEDVKPIIEAVQFKPASSKYKIFIIDECHMLSNAAWNSLLKTLEEPPPFVKFVFATTEGDKVLATIVSRCQRFDLRRILTKDIVSRLKFICEKEGIEVEDDALLAIARGAEGGMRDALSSLDQLISFKGAKITEEDALGVFGLVSRSSLENLAASILSGDDAGILEAIDAFDSAGKNMRRVSAELLSHFRNLVVFKALGAKSKSLEATAEQIKTLETQANGVDAGRIFKICDVLAETEDKLRYVLSVRTTLEISLLRAARIASTATIEELMRAVKALKEQIRGSRDELKCENVKISNSSSNSQLETGNIITKATLTSPEPQKSTPEPRTSTPEPQTSSSDARMRRPQPRTSNLESARRQAILDDEVLNSIIGTLPGASISDIKDKKQ